MDEMKNTNENMKSPDTYVGENGYEYELTEQGFYIPKIEYTDDPAEKELLKQPIRKWGRAWMKWMQDEYPINVEILICECRWQIIPREIDIEAQERFDELDELYRNNNPRPTEFEAIRSWEKMRLLELNHQVMEEIVYKVRE